MKWQRLKALTSCILALGSLVILAGVTSPSSAATISYGSFGPVPPGVMFADVEESSVTDPVPLFGPPDAFSVGLDFDPQSFVATSAGGPPPDITDGQLNFTIMSVPAVAITAISLFESGDYTLAGTGTAATQVLAGAIMQATVTQINGVDVAPINLVPVNASVGFNLAANAGLVQPWSLGLGLDVAGQLGPDQRATKIDVVIDNQLLAFSELNSVAFIAKKDFRIDVDTEVIPEPSTLLLLLTGCLALHVVIRRNVCA
jgi:hypothetical protein